MDTRRGERIVIYRGTDNQVYSLYWTDGPPDYSKLSESAHTPTAKGDPAGYYTAHDDVHQVVYRGTDDHLYELYWTGTGGVTPWDLTTKEGVPPADSDPAVYYSGGVAVSKCPAGGTHTPSGQSGSANYILPYGAPIAPSSQNNWRWCNKCQGLFYGGGLAASKCPAGGTHTPPDQSGSVDYILPYGAPINESGQNNWQWCNKCQGLYYGGNLAASKCPAGATHTPPGQSGSVDYILPFSPSLM
jgi:hypothetical protein